MERGRRKNHHGLAKQTQSQPALERNYLNIGSERANKPIDGIQRYGKNETVVEFLLGPWKDNNATVHGVTDCGNFDTGKKKGPPKKVSAGRKNRHTNITVEINVVVRVVSST